MVRLRDHLKFLNCFTIESREAVSWEGIPTKENKITLLWLRQGIGKDDVMKVFPVKDI